MSAPQDSWKRFRDALAVNAYNEHSRKYLREELDEHERSQAAARAAVAAEIAALRATVEQQAQQIAELHDIVSGYNAITDPEAFPELDARAGRVLGSESDGDCGNSICKALMVSEQLVEQQAARITALEQALKEAATDLECMGEYRSANAARQALETP